MVTVSVWFCSLLDYVMYRIFIFFIMKIVKLFVLFCFVRSVRSFRVRYCGICNNHTLCKYSVEGPSSNCVNYDRTSLLTNRDIIEILNRINERRQLVAMGLLKKFPQAANMKKMKWSVKLASFAQRWADQCDNSVKPNREDECRDLVSMRVGQNIATVLGPSPGLSVKSFVDIWFMLNLHFTGSVAYYNQSKDSKTNYFTQLIWADTAFVGCGRAKFFVDDLNTIVERLVCNFAPKGNIHGKPIYTIGYPGTQCPNQMVSDNEFPGLCLQTSKPAIKSVYNVSSASSLLRILNLSNNSLKRELDPNNLKQIHLNSSEYHDQRNQKTRDVFSNFSYGAVKRDSVHFHNPMKNIENYNDPQYIQRQFTQERGHSRMYHGYQSSKELMHNLDMGHVHTESDFRRSDYTTSVPFYSNSVQDARKHYVDSQCTRKMITSEFHNCFSPDPPCKSNTNECTRGQTHNCPKANPCQHTAFARLDKCPPCNEPSSSPSVQCDCNRKCPPTSNCAPVTTYCPYRKLGGDDKVNQFDNYDLFHNLEVRSGEEGPAPKQPWHFENLNPDKLGKAEYSRRESDLHRQVKTIVDESPHKAKKLQDSYGSFHYSERKKRDLEDQTFKPFWQMDEYNQKRPSELKSMKYTTLGNKKYRKTRKTAPTTSLPTSTETITIKPKDKSIVHYSHRGRVTEKYLSFDELMHLRKLSTAEPIESDARRKANNHPLREGESTSESTTTTITANTPFIRQKHCTRKLTCTWTAAMNNAGGGGAGGGGKGFDVGSRTPPGYVDGCTRTSTCTRDYMDRNKMVTPSEGSDGTTTLEDEDYCERRSLNIRRRNLDENGVKISSIGYQEVYTVLPLLTTKIFEIYTNVESEDTETNSEDNNFHCICYEDATRVKRGEINSFNQLQSKNCNDVKGHKHSLTKPVQYKNDDSTHIHSRSRYSLVSYQGSSDGTKSLRNMVYGMITLKYCVTWYLFYIINRPFEV